MTDGLAVIGDCEIPLKSGMGLVSSNGSTPGLVGRISADPNSLRNVNQRRNWVSDTDPRPDPTRDDSDP